MDNPQFSIDEYMKKLNEILNQKQVFFISVKYLTFKYFSRLNHLNIYLFYLNQLNDF